MKPKITLIHPPSLCVNDDRLEPSLGILYLAANLREKGHDVGFHDMSGAEDEKDIEKRISSVPYSDIYGISVFSTNYGYAKRVIERIKKKHNESYVILGGPHPSGLPDEVMTESGADAVVVGEGEEAIETLVRMWISNDRGTGIFRGNGRADIDSYPFPARDLADYSTYSRKLNGKPVVSMITSRGCHHHCAHCNSVVMGGGNKDVRYRSIENIMDEMSSLRGLYKNFRFNDDHFTGNPDIMRLLDRIADMDVKFRIFARVEDLDDAVCRALSQAGCIHVSIGIESMNPHNLEAIGKYGQAGHEKNVSIAKANGITVRASFMVGLPHDTDADIEESFSRARDLGIDEYAVYPLIPYPGTRIAKNPGRYGYRIINRDYSGYMQMGKGNSTCYALDHENFTHEDTMRWRDMASKILESGDVKHMRDSKVAG